MLENFAKQLLKISEEAKDMIRQKKEGETLCQDGFSQTPLLNSSDFMNGKMSEQDMFSKELTEEQEIDRREYMAVAQAVEKWRKMLGKG